ncbi:acyl-CoA dehydrogenase family protein [Saccharothrix syringae]|uniref:Acyl-[acyl-carrier-protein] dehydrogenase MbtN n=2 Tax=Saccharothrix syringae TaxID=103733 RepID=A0A5Q0HE55_SACSY|nr:acyl-CoA dehydrogenase family protein [Saccharothrix syringae]QFZ24566.1 acyl-CoA dehydrogenase [Saccharothrix syringae]
MPREVFTDDHRAFREVVREFVAREVTPNLPKWEKAGVVDREVWLAAGRQGLLAPEIDVEYGGGGVRDYRYHVVRGEEMARAGTLSPAFNLHSEIVGGYLDDLGTPEQKGRWLPGFCAGELIATIAITEPDTGSDIAAIRTTAHREGEDHYRLRGSKAFVTHGLLAGLVLVAALDPAAGPRSASLLVLEPPLPGLTVGEPLAKIGLHSLDTVPMTFDDVLVPRANLLGEAGAGFRYLMRYLPRERLSVAVASLALAEQVLAETLRYCGLRSAFGRPIGRFQHNRFQLAEMATAIQVARVFTDRCVVEHDRGELTPEQAAMAKWWNTDLCADVVNRCLQLHGGYGYAADSLVGRAYVQARVQGIYGGTTEIMKEIIGQSLPL